MRLVIRSALPVLLGCAACGRFGEEVRAADASTPSDGEGETDGSSSGADAGPLALWDFEEDGGALVHDRVAPALDLTIEDVASTRWADGALVIERPTRIASSLAAEKISAAVTQSSAFTVEAWVRPATLEQDGPARVVGMGRGTGERNFTFGQDGRGPATTFVVRLRSEGFSGVDDGSAMSTPPGSVTGSLQHVVFTRTAEGARTFYVDGAAVRTNDEIKTPLTSWSGAYKLTMANEDSAARPWLGELHLVAIYARALAADEVASLHDAGAKRLTR